MSNTSCPDVLWEVFDLLGDSRHGSRPPAFVLSMDLAKCFDHLDLDVLRSVCEKLSLPSCLVALSNYAPLTRLLFVDNEPSDVWLEGKCITGIPQGCPLACFLCNLAAHAWHRTCDRVAPSSRHWTYLDDRLIITNSWSDMQIVLDATKSLDLALGPQLNFRKCCRGVVQPGVKTLPRVPRNCGSVLAIEYKTSFKYLGVDVVLSSGGSQRPTALRRLADFKARCKLGRLLLPRHQSGACLSDAVPALWLPGGTSLGCVQFSEAVSAAF